MTTGSCSWLDGVACVVVSLNLMTTGSCPWLDGVACVVVRLPTGSCPWLDGVACVVTTLVSCPCHDDGVCVMEVTGWGMSRKSYVGCLWFGTEVLTCTSGVHGIYTPAI